MNNKIIKLSLALMLMTSLSGCGVWTKLQRIGKEPEISPLVNPVEARKEDPIPTEIHENQQYAGANSLWKKGSSGFFKDQRASKVGDIITVQVIAKDGAVMENKTEQNRDNNKQSMGISALGGYENYLGKFMPGGVTPGNMFDVTSNQDISGEGKIDRKEKIDMTMAAVVTQVLGNGNLVIEGTQEIRVNYELRQLSVKGIIRRADISSDNSIESTKIAELRVSYGGEGTVSDMQEPRYGRSFLDAVSPF